MNPILHPHSPVTPMIQNREELEAVVENIVHLQKERAELESFLENEIAALRRQYREPLVELERYLDLETKWVENWARQNPDVLGERRALECRHAEVGFRTTPPRLERISRRTAWSEIVARLTGIAWGRPYLRDALPEVNREALLADRAKISCAELNEVGLRVVQEERFYLHPHSPEENAAWQEAA